MQGIFDLDTGRFAALRSAVGSDGRADGFGMPGGAGTADDSLRAVPFGRVVDSAFGISSAADDGADGCLVVVLGEQPGELVAAPGRLLHTAAELRDRGHRIALAGVGTSPASLAILPLLQPDLIEVDLGTLERQPDWQRAQTINAITAYSEELPALVLAVGVDSDADLLLARSLGATLGQGAAVTNGRPGSMVQADSEPAGIVFDTPPRPARGADHTPFSVTAADHPVRIATRAQLLKTSQVLETVAFDCDEATVVLSTFQKTNDLTPDVVELYSALARNLSYVFALTHVTESKHTTPSDVPHLRVRVFGAEHPLSREWNVIIVNARYQAMLVARETVGPDPDPDEQLFEYVLTHHRETVLHAAQALVPLL